MTPQRKLTIANIVMALALAPLLLAELFVGMTLSSDWKADSRHEALALTMFLAMIYTLPIAVTVALPASIWSWLTARRAPELATGRILRKAVYILLLLPLVAMVVYPGK
ncbi:hypothetical protein GCM10027277_10010 [Pseudoduganella ginsengisoli]|uniref:DUF2269 family protein n=1 Tax=Pseudoduganella ginsengisoli TaxID=1462440 RepID=A0A6L6PV80_9BURK|nr:hypothetical protein [Pseudoduganella ginsengisoli]MTW01397.1 hypothetical protein [Pseudoduganella ginsengisoli]